MYAYSYFSTPLALQTWQYGTQPCRHAQLTYFSLGDSNGSTTNDYHQIS
jgi:hypothetical protein